MSLIMLSGDEKHEDAVEFQDVQSLSMSAPSAMQRAETALSNSTTICDDMPSPPLQNLQLGERVPDSLETLPGPSISDGAVVDLNQAPDCYNAKVTERMAWIMQMGMDVLLPQLSVEDRSIIEGKTDLVQLIIPLFQTWEESRRADRSAKKNRLSAAAVHDKLKGNFRKTELFDRFWSRKLTDEEDGARWKRFKEVVRTIIGQVTLIDRMLSAANMANVFLLGRR